MFWLRITLYSKTCLKRPLKMKTKTGFQHPLSINVGQKYCRMLQGEHSAKLLTFIKLPFVIKIFVLSVFEWPFYTGFTVHSYLETYVSVENYRIHSYYIPITDTTLELSVFWPSDTEGRINELRFSESISLSFKTRLTSVTCFCGNVT